ncbi:helix-turn-helix domain-containing protein [Cohnella cellulosilytica]|uniref:Helix-turn-helix domain-containing protein n=1 Tax=Cohnella cellulosilytica TaxID=986710 RepID=A0ABW2FBG5_9BACL
MSEFGDLLKSLRKDYKISQRKLAELVGIDFTYISKIESGAMDPPAEDKIIKMAEVFQVNPDQLLISAKKVPSELQKIITEHQDVPVFLRKASSFSSNQWERIRGIMNETPEDGEK